MINPQLRWQARRLYKELHHLGKDYPDPSYNFHKRLRQCFLSTGSKVTTDDEMRAAIDKADFVRREVETLIFLKKYRQSESHEEEGLCVCRCKWCCCRTSHSLGSSGRVISGPTHVQRSALTCHCLAFHHLASGSEAQVLWQRSTLTSLLWE